MYKHLISEQRFVIYLMLQKDMSQKDIAAAIEVSPSTIVRLLKPYRKWIKTITTDNGSEFFRHEYITRKLGIKVYFADPHAPWQKGSIENTNGLIRQYIPNGTDFKNVSQQKIKMIQRKINARPGKKLNILTPDEVVYKKTL